MGSNDRAVQLSQKERTEQELSSRLATLAERGVDEKSVSKDTVVRHLRSDIAALKRRLATIDALEERKKKLAERKAKKLAAPKKDKKKGKKKAETPPQQKGKAKAKKKKK